MTDSKTENNAANSMESEIWDLTVILILGILKSDGRTRDRISNLPGRIKVPVS